jgi:hypothetical protein
LVVLNKKLAPSLFPGEYLDIRIPDISFEATRLGDFTFRNAFFNKNHLL